MHNEGHGSATRRKELARQEQQRGKAAARFERNKKKQPSTDNHSGEDPDFARIRASIHGGAVTQREFPGDPARCELLELESSSAGARWAACCRDELRKQSRLAAGGWPGTMSEARAHVAAYVGTELRRRGMGALTHQESELAARAVYAAARRHWLLRREPEASEP